MTVAEKCAIGGCDREAILRRAGVKVCRGHYSRHHRYGTFGSAEIRPKREKRQTCVVDGCTELDEGLAGYCPKHATRWRRHRDVSTVIEPESRAVKRGDEHPQWGGDGITYGGMHIRVRRERGPASRYECVDCGQPSFHWSYNRRGGSAERVGETAGYKAAYSVRADDYVPRCVPCHKRFDLSQGRSVEP